ncbi:MAG: cohesin domain-containing protein [Acidobacteriota bacterium]
MLPRTAFIRPPCAVAPFLVFGLLLLLAAGTGLRPIDPPQAAVPVTRPQTPAKPGSDDKAAATGAKARLILISSRRRLKVGRPLQVTLKVRNADSLLRVPATLLFDPEILQLVSVEAGPAWDDGPEPVLLHHANKRGELTIGIARLGADAVPIQGSAKLLRVNFRAVGSGTTRLHLKSFAVLGPGSTQQPARAKSATVTVR